MSGNIKNKKKLVKASSGQCIWVDAGVISYRLCTLNYECERCSLHQALIDSPVLVQPGMSLTLDQAEFEERRAEFDKFFEKLPAEARKCRYMLTGDVSYKLCINSFRCASCSFQQMMEDSITAEVTIQPSKTDVIYGLRFKGDLHYHRGHVWARVEREGDVRIGLDDFGQQLLGPIREVDLPGIGDAVYEGVSACKLGHKQGGIHVQTPISGRIIAVNKMVSEHPELINDSPYNKGWLYIVKPHDLPSELVNLLYGTEARHWFEQEINRVVKRLYRDSGKRKVVSIEKGAIWKECDCIEMANEFLLAVLEKAA
ncbi:MAG: hypothetical protein GXP49_15630 [Deltaproteobacteria bacterium]|nr:hypothetical protein [Deltaproteobacteria bacterium]